MRGLSIPRAPRRAIGQHGVLLLAGVLLAFVSAACGQSTATVSPAASTAPATAVTATVPPVASSPPSATVSATPSPPPSAAVAVAPPVTADWPMRGGDPARRGEGGQGPVGSPVLHWRFQAQGSVNTVPAIVGGVAYVVSDEGTLHALDVATGKELWSFAGAKSPEVGPMVSNGVVYVTDGTGTIHAVDATTGKERWHSATPIPGGITIGDGRIYVASSGAVVALDPTNGTERWRYTAQASGFFHNPAFADGVVYEGSDLGGVVALDAATGTVRWHADTGTDATATAVVANGIVYVGDNGSAKGHLYAFDAGTGKQLWRVDEAIFSPAVSEGVAYSGSAAGYVSAHDAATGAPLWRFPVKGEANTVSVAAGVVYVPATGEHRVYALDAGNGHELWHFDIDSGMDGTIAVAGGSIYLGTSVGSVYAIGGGLRLRRPAPRLRPRRRPLSRRRSHRARRQPPPVRLQ